MHRVGTSHVHRARTPVSSVRIASVGAAFCLLLAGCGHSNQGTPTSAASPSETVSATTSPPTTAATTTTTPVASDSCYGNPVGPTTPDATTTTVSSATSWPQVTIVAGVCPQVLDVAAGAAFSLVSPPSTSQGPWVLQRTDLGRATTESGPTFSPVSSVSSVSVLTVAAGYLWISCGRSDANSVGPVLCQVDPRTLAVVRQIQLPPPQGLGRAIYPLAVAEGPDNTIWVGYGPTLVHVDVGAGAVRSSVPISSGTVASLSVDPTGRYLYAALSYPTIDGKTVDGSVLELDADTGYALAATSSDSEVTDSVAGGIVTAVPGGVWDSFRTGMLGETVFLRQADLVFSAPSSSELEQEQPAGVFHWIMDAETIYGDGALVLVNQNGVLACVDPSTGVIRTQEHLAAAEEGNVELLAVVASAGQVLVSDGSGVQAITPPAACWG